MSSLLVSLTTRMRTVMFHFTHYRLFIEIRMSYQLGKPFYNHLNMQNKQCYFDPSHFVRLVYIWHSVGYIF